eukprot:CAMPEP_0171181422 /NCGR_PEP_ID=MMETSP0790-20130122/14252_1 /TAXON_ID=2925 /ORGANISM="Alexandrium catenella, Strain OF101" /LENGTH=71 /DNA_ID=CAMNT_0011646361 /DNA_START=114 /DNA_END=329 /DNA_ORIENTATION=+
MDRLLRRLEELDADLALANAPRAQPLLDLGEEFSDLLFPRRRALGPKAEVDLLGGHVPHGYHHDLHDAVIH